ncbi:MAG TPA: hypothetical protein VK348_04055, partial [Planctomycetota bacterium]|nr:hypothetical protein [Planctomycetota bacterium]
MNLSKNLFVLSTLLLATTATAQFRVGQVTQQRGSSYNGSIGNTWLGGAVNAHALLTTSAGLLYNRATLDVGGNAAVNLLSHSANLALVSGTCSNGSSGFPVTQSRSGNFHVQVVGIDLINQSFQSDSTFARQTWTFNAFGPNGVSAPIPVGPITISLRGNVGAGLTISCSYALPAASLSVSAGGYAQAYGFGDASVGFGIPGFSVG